MIATRVKNSSTDRHAGMLIDFINDQHCSKVVFNASPRTEADGPTNSDGSAENFPLFTAAALYTIPHVGDVVVLTSSPA